MKETQIIVNTEEQPFTIHDGVGFSPQEKRLLLEYCGKSTLNRWSWYGVYLLPMIVFAGYGVFQRDVVAIAVAFGALLVFILWSLYGGVQSITHLRGVFTKYEAYIGHLETERERPLQEGDT